MPTVNPGSKILVTGANGYIPIWVVRRLLEKGYSVRGTVRAAEKGEHLKSTFKSFGDKLEVVVVPDITVDGAFDEAVKGVDGIEHMASPFHGNVDEPSEFINPAVNGTVGVLKSALKNAPNVKRIVITSSCAAVMSITSEPTTFSELDWNEQSIQEVNEHGRATPPMTKYRASKTLAEKAAWAFHKEHKDEVSWDLAVLNPPFVFGPLIQEVSSPATLNTSMKAWWDNAVSTDPLATPEALAAGSSWIDVRDLADAHVLALEKEAAGGERVIISAGAFVWQDWVETASAVQPSPLPNHTLPKGHPDVKRVYTSAYDTAKMDRIYGLKLRTKEEVARDILEDFATRGW